MFKYSCTWPHVTVLTPITFTLSKYVCWLFRPEKEEGDIAYGCIPLLIGFLTQALLNHLPLKYSENVKYFTLKKFAAQTVQTVDSQFLHFLKRVG